MRVGLFFVPTTGDTHMTTRIRRRDTVAVRIRITEVLGTVALGAMTGLLIAWLGINVITQCGETTRTIDGNYIKGECVLVPWVD